MLCVSASLSAIWAGMNGRACNNAQLCGHVTMWPCNSQRLRACVHVCVRACVQMDAYMHVCAWTCVSTHVHGFLPGLLRVCTRARARACYVRVLATCAHVCILACMRVGACTCACLRAHACPAYIVAGRMGGWV